jgi:putative transposase
MPDRPPRLHRVFRRYDPPLYFVTFNTHQRRNLLANSAVHHALIKFAERGRPRGIAIGRYVVMPNHVHLFVRGGLVIDATEWRWQGEIERLEA